MSRSSTEMANNNRLLTGIFVAFTTAVWLGIALRVGLGRTVFFIGVFAIVGGYFLLRLARAVERIATAAERLVEIYE